MNGGGMLTTLVVLNCILTIIAIAFFLLFRSYRRRLYINEGRNLNWPIRTVPLGDFDPLFARGEHGPTLAAEVHFIGRGDGVPGGTSDREAWVLAVLAKHARRMFEFGTCTGRSTYLWARNSPEQAEIITITLPPERIDEYRHEGGDSSRARDVARRESRFERFLYTDTAVEPKVTQRFEDSKTFDETPYVARCDLVFVDGSHAYSYVRSDSLKALRMVAPGGVVLWHDYRGPDRGAEDVFRYLNELAHSVDLVHLEGTTLVAYRAPASRTAGVVPQGIAPPPEGHSRPGET